MLETGQPLHFYDEARIAGGRLIVRDAAPGEKLITLDGVEHELSARALVVADARGALGLAGLKGGKSSEISPSTAALVLESANFNGARVRRMSADLGLRTEASTRHEKNLAPALTDAGAARAAQLLVALAGPNLWFTVVALLLTGICYTIYTSSTNAIVQLATPGFLQGRTGRTLQLRFYGQRSVGRLAGGRARRTEYEPGLRRRRRIRAGHGRRRIRAAAVADAHRYGHRASKRAISSSSAALNA